MYELDEKLNELNLCISGVEGLLNNSDNFETRYVKLLLKNEGMNTNINYDGSEAGVWETVKKAVAKVWDWIKSAFKFIYDIFTKPAGLIKMEKIYKDEINSLKATKENFRKEDKLSDTAKTQFTGKLKVYYKENIKVRDSIVVGNDISEKTKNKSEFKRIVEANNKLINLLEPGIADIEERKLNNNDAIDLLLKTYEYLLDFLNAINKAGKSICSELDKNLKWYEEHKDDESVMEQLKEKTKESKELTKDLQELTKAVK